MGGGGVGGGGGVRGEEQQAAAGQRRSSVCCGSLMEDRATWAPAAGASAEDLRQHVQIQKGD